MPSTRWRSAYAAFMLLFLANVKLASAQDDSIVIDVEHGGGCREHRYQLLAGSAFAESHPVQAGLRVSHDDGGDDGCCPEGGSRHVHGPRFLQV